MFSTSIPKVQMSFDKIQRNPSKKVFEFFSVTPFSEKPVSEIRGVTHKYSLLESQASTWPEHQLVTQSMQDHK